MIGDREALRIEVGRAGRVVGAACLIGAGGLVAAHAIRLAAVLEPRWWMFVLVLTAGIAADLSSGLVHWAADTWGRESMAIVGPRFLRPFRVHHLNPDDFLRRSFVDCNGDIAMFMLPSGGSRARMSVPSHAGHEARTSEPAVG